MGHDEGMRGITTAGIAAALLLSGCSTGPSEGDRVACQTVIDADNAISAEVASEHTDRDLLVTLMRAVPGEVEAARDVAESPDLQVELRRLHGLSDHNEQMADSDVGVAYQMQVRAVERACQGLGVDVALTDG